MRSAASTHRVGVFQQKLSPGFPVLLGALMLCCAWAVPAHAQSEGRVIQDGSIIWKSDVSLVAATAKAGLVLQLTGRIGRWYEVVIPESLGGGRGERGRIAISAIRLLPGSPEPPIGQSTGRAGPQRPALSLKPKMPFRGFVALGGAYYTASSFVDDIGLRVYDEDGGFRTDYETTARPAFAATAGVMLSPRLGIGAAVESVSRSTHGSLIGSIPHPFFFDRPRLIGAEVTGLRRQEVAVHVQMRGVQALGTRAELSVFGGPTVLRVTQDVVETISYADAYPYDVATFSSMVTASPAAVGFGFNAGGDVTVFLTRHVGVGFTGLFTRASVDLPTVDGHVTESRSDGVRLGAGVRLRF